MARSQRVVASYHDDLHKALPSLCPVFDWKSPDAKLQRSPLLLLWNRSSEDTKWPRIRRRSISTPRRPSLNLAPNVHLKLNYAANDILLDATKRPSLCVPAPALWLHDEPGADDCRRNFAAQKRTTGLMQSNTKRLIYHLLERLWGALHGCFVQRLHRARRRVSANHRHALEQWWEVKAMENLEAMSATSSGHDGVSCITDKFHSTRQVGTLG